MKATFSKYKTLLFWGVWVMIFVLLFKFFVDYQEKIYYNYSSQNKEYEVIVEFDEFEIDYQEINFNFCKGFYQA